MKKRKHILSKNVFLCNLWYRMNNRTKGKDTNRPHLYIGKECLTYKEFKPWALSHPWFNRLWNAYVASEYVIRLAPSVDRKDTSLGYTIDNMRWISNSRNCSLGAHASHAARKRNKEIRNKK